MRNSWRTLGKSLLIAVAIELPFFLAMVKYQSKIHGTAFFLLGILHAPSLIIVQLLLIPFKSFIADKIYDTISGYGMLCIQVLLVAGLIFLILRRAHPEPSSLR